MISIEQVRLLEQRVNKAVAKISALQQENTTLREEIGAYQTRVQELEQQIMQIKEDQTAIEQGILSALGQLDQLEDELTEDGEPGAAPPDAEDGEVFAGERVTPDDYPDPAEHSDQATDSHEGGTVLAGNQEQRTADSGELEIF